MNRRRILLSSAPPAVRTLVNISNVPKWSSAPQSVESVQGYTGTSIRLRVRNNTPVVAVLGYRFRAGKTYRVEITTMQREDTRFSFGATNVRCYETNYELGTPWGSDAAADRTEHSGSVDFTFTARQDIEHFYIGFYYNNPTNRLTIGNVYITELRGSNFDNTANMSNGGGTEYHLINLWLLLLLLAKVGDRG